MPFANDAPESTRRYYAVFISYRHADNKETGRQWATWLHQALETYEVPKDLVGTNNNRGEPIPESLYPVFRDEEELPADADLTQNISRALENSVTLVVLCSPRSVDSQFVADEIRYFKELGKSERILALMIDGEPNASDDPGKHKAGISPEMECLPEPLRRGVWREEGGIDWSQRTEPIAADARPQGMPVQGWTTGPAYRLALSREGKLTAREITARVHEYEERLGLAKLKVIAGALGVSLGTLTQRDKAHQLDLARKRARVFRRVAFAMGLLAVAAIGGGILAAGQTREARKQRELADDQKQNALHQQHEAQVAFSNADCVSALERANNHQDAVAIAYLCRALRTNPGNHQAAALLFSALTTRNWVVPRERFQAEGEDLTALDSNGRLALTRKDSKGRVWDMDTRRIIREIPDFTFGIVPSVFSPDGHYLILGAAGVPKKLDLASNLQSPIGAGNDMDWFSHLFRFSPDGRNVALSKNGQIQSWSLADNQPLGTPVKQPSDPVQGVPIAISRDGSRALTTGGNVILWDGAGDLVARDLKPGPIQVWDVATGQPLCRIANVSASGMHLATFSPDGQFLAAATRVDNPNVRNANTYNTLRVWNSSTGEERGTSMAHDDDIGAVSWSADGRFVLTASGNMVRIWNAGAGRLETPPLYAPDQVLDAWFSPDGKRVIAVVVNRAGVDLSAEPGLRTFALNPSGPEKDTLYKPQTALTWDAALADSLAAEWSQEPWVLDAKFSPDGRRVVTTSGTAAQIWDASTHELKGTLPMDDVPVCAVFSRDGGRLLLVSNYEKSARVWDVATCQAITPPIRDQEEIQFAQEHNNRSVTSVGFSEPVHPDRNLTGDFSPDGKYVATVTGFSARIWDAATGKPVSGPLRHDGYASSVCFSRDGLVLLTSSADDATARLWDVKTGKAIGQPIHPLAGVLAAALSPDGQYVATAGSDFTVLVWNSRTGKTVSSFKQADAITTVGFSPDSKNVIITAGNSARIWNALTGEAISAPMSHNSPLTSAMFSPDGNYVVTASKDHAARIFDAITGLLVSMPIVHADVVNTAAFSADGRFVVSAGDDGVVKIQQFSSDIPPSWILDLAESLAGCSLDKTGALSYLPGKTADWLRQQAGRETDKTDPMVIWARRILKVE